jgi:hypothetical protein
MTERHERQAGCHIYSDENYRVIKKKRTGCTQSMHCLGLFKCFLDGGFSLTWAKSIKQLCFEDSLFHGRLTAIEESALSNQDCSTPTDLYANHTDC